MFCNGALTDLNPLLQKAGIDTNKVFPKTMLDYTQYQGNQCTLPLLGDAYGPVLQQGHVRRGRDHRAAARPCRSSTPTPSS